MNEPKVAMDTRPRWLRRLTRGDWPSRIMHASGSDWGGNAAPPGGGHHAFRYEYFSAEDGKGCADSKSVPHSLHYHVAAMQNDGFEVGFGYCHKWEWQMPFKDALRFSLWLIFRMWAWEMWFGLRRWIYYRALTEAVKPYKNWGQKTQDSGLSASEVKE